MRWPLLLLVVLLAGCMVPPPGDAGEHPCAGRSSHASGVHEGAWENATAASGFRVHGVDDGVPVGPRVAALLGSEANVTSVRWRVDGGDVQDTHRESWRDGVLTSPEVLTVRFWNGPELDGVLDGRRSDEDAARVVASFLDAVRGPQPDNADLAAAFVPTATADRGPRAMSTDGSDLEPQRPWPRPLTLPDGPWTVSSHLAAHADESTLRVDAEEVAVVDGAWQWRLEVPRASNATYGPGVAWYLAVDALDRVLVLHDSNVTLDEAAFRQRLLEFLPRHGIHADLDAWRLRPDEGYGDVCPPSAAPPPELP